MEYLSLFAAVSCATCLGHAIGKRDHIAVIGLFIFFTLGNAAYVAMRLS